MCVRVKICGICRADDARAAAEAGADAVGLVFYRGSKRCVGVAQAQEIVRALPPFVSVVALFVNETAENVRDVLAQVPVDVLQFHGDEDDAFCRQFARPYLKAVRVRGADDVRGACAAFPHARGLLFDAYHPDEYGGTGLQFDWNLLKNYAGKPWVLAGGLNADNVAEAVRISGAAAVDVSGGVEAAHGVKDHAKIRAFVQAARGAAENAVK